MLYAAQSTAQGSEAFQHGVNDIMSDLFSIQDIFQALSEEIQQFIFFIGLNESKQALQMKFPSCGQEESQQYRLLGGAVRKGPGNRSELRR